MQARTLNPEGLAIPWPETWSQPEKPYNPSIMIERAAEMAVCFFWKFLSGRIMSLSSQMSPYEPWSAV